MCVYMKKHERDFMNGERLVWMNGALKTDEYAKVPILSHSFSRASAIFESLGVHESSKGPKAFRLDRHICRLERSAELLGMEMKYCNEEIIEAVSQTVRANNIGRGLIKIMAYWGHEAVVDLVPKGPLDLAIFAIPNGGELHLDEPTPISTCLSKWRKLHPSTVPLEAKAVGNYLNGYLARKDALDRGFDIGLLQDENGFVAEGSTESVFIVKDGSLLTPPLGGILSGISRMTILELVPHLKIRTLEKKIRVEDLRSADEMFTAHSGVKVHPVYKFEEHDFPAPGPITERLMQTMEDVLSFRDDRFSHFFQSL